MARKPKKTINHRRKLKNKKQVKSMRGWSFLLIFASILLIFFGAYLYSKLTPEVTISKGQGILAIPVGEHDFGNVSVRKGVVTTEVPLVNIGEEDLVIHFLDSSCGCTTAKVINKGKDGPVFGMASSGKSPTKWQTIIEPGEQATLKIYYDPAVHPNFRGQATREITVFSNEAKSSTKKVRIKVNQID